MEIIKIIKKLSKEIEDEIIQIRRDLHQHPELGFKEYRTASIIEKFLKDLNLEVQTGVAETGVLGLLKGNKPGPVIGIRADMDALSIKEKTNLPYMSIEEGKMHACGHDAHIAILLGVARVLSTIRDEITGNIKFIFQPAEEGPGGALPMIKEGVLKNPDVDYILSLHVWPEIESGTVGLKSGPLFASVDEVDISIQGLGSHGAYPYQGVDAVYIAAEVINSLQAIVSREIDSLEPAVITFGKINGGYRRNVIADEVIIEGTVRCFKAELRDFIESRIEEVTAGICAAFRGKYNIDYRRQYPPLCNNMEMTKKVEKILKKGFHHTGIKNRGELNLIKVKEVKSTLGGEDFAFFLEKVPGCILLLGTGNKEKGIENPLHSPYFKIDENILAVGVEVMSTLIVKFLENNV